MKPSERINKRAAELYHLRLQTIVRQTGSAVNLATQRFESCSADATAMAEALDEFDARLAKLEANAPPPEELDPTKPLYVGDGAPRVTINRLAQGVDLASEEQPTSPCSHCGKALGVIICTTSAAPGKKFCSVGCSQTAYTPDLAEPEQ